MAEQCTWCFSDMDDDEDWEDCGVCGGLYCPFCIDDHDCEEEEEEG